MKALRAVPGLALCDEATLLEIVGDSVNLHWRAGAVVFERGAPADALFFVLTGAVRVRDPAGSEVARLVRADDFGEIALLLGVPHRNEVIATEDTELMVVPKERVDALFAANPELAERIRRTAEERAGASFAAYGGWRFAPEPASRRSLITPICSFVFLFRYCSACSSFAGASGFMENSCTQRMLVPSPAGSKYHSMFMYSKGPVSIR